MTHFLRILGSACVFLAMTFCGLTPVGQQQAVAVSFDTQGSDAAADHVPTAIDWCAMARSDKYGNYERQRVLGECAHIKFSAKYDGDRVKYTRSGISVVPDGKTDSGRTLMELKPNGSAARKAAKKTASVSGLKTLAYYWGHLGGDRFEFVNTTNAGQGVSPQGTRARSTYPKSHSARGFGVPLARGGAASGYRFKGDEMIHPDTEDSLTPDEEKLLADWDEYTDQELADMGFPVLPECLDPTSAQSCEADVP